MGKITGFLEIDRNERKYAPVAERVKHYREFVIPLSEKDARDQAARCMNCGIPYCPAPCEASCTLNIDNNPVTIKTIECAIVDRAWDNGWLPPEIAPNKTGKKIAVIGSGPAGLACAQQLARAGHEVHVYEKFAKAGGLLRYGIPDFKMEKHVIDRRIAQMEAEGVVFHYNNPVGGSAPGALDPQT
jgi:glutamate synthase (NADPH/NADH) small chain